MPAPSRQLPSLKHGITYKCWTGGVQAILFAAQFVRNYIHFSSIVLKELR